MFNGKKDVVEEIDVDIEICLIDYMLDNGELDIDIYFFDDDRKFDIVNGVENYFVNGLIDLYVFVDLEI